jgi:hypothetical protein
MIESPDQQNNVIESMASGRQVLAKMKYSKV